jgi:hypothetical protein
VDESQERGQGGHGDDRHDRTVQPRQERHRVSVPGGPSRAGRTGGPGRRP